MCPLLTEMFHDDAYYRFVVLMVWFNHGDWNDAQRRWQEVWGAARATYQAGPDSALPDERVTTIAISRLLPQLEASHAAGLRRGDAA